MDLHHLSASSIKTWDTCQLQFYADKVLEVPRSEPHPLTRMGSAVHYAFEMAQTSGSRDALAHLPQACNDAGVEDPQLVQKAGDLCNVCEQWGWWDGIDNLDQCIAEQEFLISVGAGVLIKGFIDRLDIKGDTARILDIKTQAKKFTAEELRTNLQADIYAWATRRMFPNIVEPIRVEFWTLRHEVQAVTRTKDDADATEAYLAEKGNGILEGDSATPPPPSPSHLCRWCNYIEDCPEWK